MLPLLVAIACIFTACEKFLDEKTNKALAVPNTVKDLQALLDTYYLLNESDPSADEVSAGEFYVTDTDFGTRSETDQRLYTWQNSNVLPLQANDWYYCYTIIYRANTVLAQMKEVKVTNVNAESLNNLKGQACFFRAKAYLQAVNIWAKGYDAKTAQQDVGIPIRDNINFNEVSKRATLQQNYDFIITDLKAAIDLLPDKQLHVLRPSKPAAMALLSRTYLWMGQYEQALHYATLSLQLKSQLLDYNTLTATATYPLSQFNTEVLFASRMLNLPIMALSRAKMSPELYQSYEANDLRRTLYYRDNGNGSYGFKGSYDGTSLYFSGLATDEVYLTSAECNARLGKIPEALKDLNTLLKKRYKTGTFIDYTLADQQAVLQLILKERRKELVFRGLRWADIKRLNRDGAGLGLTRVAAGKTYTLPANSARFAIPIPDNLIEFGIPQNQY